MTTYIKEPVFLYDKQYAAGWQDSRPCFNADASLIVFMRQVPSTKENPSPPAALYTIIWQDSGETSPGTIPVQFYPFDNVVPTHTHQATRPDCSWKTNSIAFTGSVPNNGKTIQHGLFFLSPDESPVYVEIKHKSRSISYPSWYPDGQHIAVTDYSVNQILKVDTSKAGSPQTAIELTATNQIWAGMSSVNQVDSTQLCMAAQPPVHAPKDSHTDMQARYNQNANNVWVQPSLPTPSYPIQVNGHGNGRAPWWSPNGECIVFESNYMHADGKSLAIFIYRVADQSITPVTPLSGWSCQHAKWHTSNPSQLVCSAKQFVGGVETRAGIAVVDIS